MPLSAKSIFSATLASPAALLYVSFLDLATVTLHSKARRAETLHNNISLMRVEGGRPRPSSPTKLRRKRRKASASFIISHDDTILSAKSSTKPPGSTSDVRWARRDAVRASQRALMSSSILFRVACVDINQ